MSRYPILRKVNWEFHRFILRGPTVYPDIFSGPNLVVPGCGYLNLFFQYPQLSLLEIPYHELNVGINGFPGGQIIVPTICLIECRIVTLITAFPRFEVILVVFPNTPIAMAGIGSACCNFRKLIRHVASNGMTILFRKKG